MITWNAYCVRIHFLTVTASVRIVVYETNVNVHYLMRRQVVKDGNCIVNEEGIWRTEIKAALDRLLIDRRNEFRELAEAIFWNAPSTMDLVKGKEEFILNFCLDVNEAFKSWSGETETDAASPMMTLTILRQISHAKTSMTQVAHLLNMAYSIAKEFEEIYKRLR